MIRFSIYSVFTFLFIQELAFGQGVSKKPNGLIHADNEAAVLDLQIQGVQKQYDAAKEAIKTLIQLQNKGDISNAELNAKERSANAAFNKYINALRQLENRPLVKAYLVRNVDTNLNDLDKKLAELKAEPPVIDKASSNVKTLQDAENLLAKPAQDEQAAAITKEKTDNDTAYHQAVEAQAAQDVSQHPKLDLPSARRMEAKKLLPVYQQKFKDWQTATLPTLPNTKAYNQAKKQRQDAEASLNALKDKRAQHLSALGLSEDINMETHLEILRTFVKPRQDLKTQADAAMKEKMDAEKGQKESLGSKLSPENTHWVQAQAALILKDLEIHETVEAFKKPAEKKSASNADKAVLAEASTTQPAATTQPAKVEATKIIELLHGPARNKEICSFFSGECGNANASFDDFKAQIDFDSNNKFKSDSSKKHENNPVEDENFLGNE